MAFNHWIGAALLAGAPAAALAVATVPGVFSAELPGTTAAAEPVLAGGVISDTSVPFATPAGYALRTTGTVQVRVVRGADGKLAYYWKINNAAGSRDYVRSVAIEGFPRHVYDANYRTDGLGTVAPRTVRGWIGSDGYYWLGFTWQTPIRAGESSRFFFLRSPATESAAAGTGRPGGMTLYFGNTTVRIPIPRPAG